MMMHRTIATIACAVLAGCAAPSTLLVNDQGEVGRCATMGWGWAGAPLAVMTEQRCVDDAKRIGFSELPPARLGVAFEFTNPPIVRQILPGSPAQASGLLVGDALLQIDGRDVHGTRDALEAFGQKKPGTVAVLLISRGGAQMTLSAIFPPS